MMSRNSFRLDCDLVSQQAVTANAFFVTHHGFE